MSKSRLTNSSNPPPTARHPKSNVEYEAEPLDDAKKLSFAVYCLFSDLNDIRNLLPQLWKDNKAGTVDLITAAITTNTAIDLVRRIQEDFVEDFAKQFFVANLVNLFFGIQCFLRGHDPAVKQMPDDPFNLACYDIADWLFLPAYTQLANFAALAEPDHLYVHKPGHFSTYDPRSHRTTKSNRGKYHEDRIVLLEVLAGFCFVAQMTNEIPAEDELTHGLRGLIGSREIPLWLVFAAQSFLDIHHIYRQDVGNAFAVLQSTGKEATQTFEQNFQHHQSCKIANWPPHNDTGLRRLIKFIDEWSQEDAIVKSANKIFKKYPGPHSPHVPSDFHLLRRHPLLCALSCFSIRVQVHEVSVIFANTWGSIMYLGHIYNAVSHEGFCARTWPDMEHLLNFHTPKQFFGVLELFKARYCDNANLFGLNLALVERTLNERFTVIKPVGHVKGNDDLSNEEAPNNTPQQEKNPTKNQQKKQTKKPTHSIPQNQTAIRSRSPFATTHHLSSYEPLLVLPLAISDEIPALQCDYFAFHRTCWSLFRRVRRELYPLFVDLGGGEEEYAEGEHQLPFVVGVGFAGALRGEGGAQAAAGGVRAGSRLLEAAGEVGERFLGEEERTEERYVSR